MKICRAINGTLKTAGNSGVRQNGIFDRDPVFFSWIRERNKREAHGLEI